MFFPERLESLCEYMLEENGSEIAIFFVSVLLLLVRCHGG